MTLLALDLGTTTGYALGSPGAVISGTAVFKTDRYTGGGMRFLRFRRWLDEMHESVGFTEVVFEEVRNHKGIDAAHVYGGLLGHLTAWCEEHGVPYSGEPVGSIKKYATGKGNANKEAMIEAVKSWGFSPKDDNEADALALLHLRLTADPKNMAAESLL